MAGSERRSLLVRQAKCGAMNGKGSHLWRKVRALQMAGRSGPQRTLRMMAGSPSTSSTLTLPGIAAIQRTAKVRTAPSDFGPLQLAKLSPGSGPWRVRCGGSGIAQTPPGGEALLKVSSFRGQHTSFCPAPEIGACSRFPRVLSTC